MSFSHTSTRATRTRSWSASRRSTAADAGSRLADEIRLSIDYYMTQPQAQPVGEVVLSGPGSGDEGLVESLGVHLGLPVRVAFPLGGLDTSGMASSEDPHRYTVAAGLSLGATA